MARRKRGHALVDVIQHYKDKHMNFTYDPKAGTLIVTVCGKGSGERSPSACPYATLIQVIGCWPCMENGFRKRR